MDIDIEATISFLREEAIRQLSPVHYRIDSAVHVVRRDDSGVAIGVIAFYGDTFAKVYQGFGATADTVEQVSREIDDWWHEYLRRRFANAR